MKTAKRKLYEKARNIRRNNLPDLHKRFTVDSKMAGSLVRRYNMFQEMQLVIRASKMKMISLGNRAREAAAKRKKPAIVR